MQYAMLNEAHSAGDSPRLATWQRILVRPCHNLVAEMLVARSRSLMQWVDSFHYNYLLLQNCIHALFSWFHLASLVDRKGLAALPSMSLMDLTGVTDPILLHAGS